MGKLDRKGDIAIDRKARTRSRGRLCQSKSRRTAC